MMGRVCLTAAFSCLLAFSAQAQEFMNVSDVQIGMTGYAKTVVQGTEIQTFPVEILGVMKNSGPSGDLILAKFSGPLIEQTGGAAHLPQVALLLAGPCRFYLGRHRCQALCGGSGPKGTGRPSEPHRAHRHGGGRAFPQHLPGQVGRSRATPRCSILIPNKDHTDDLGASACTASGQRPSGTTSRSSSSRTTPPTRPPLPIIRMLRSGTRGPESGRLAGKGLQLLSHQQLRPEGGAGRVPAAAEQRRGGAERRLAHRAAAAVRPPRRCGHLRHDALLSRRDAPACGRRHGSGRLRGPQP